MFWNKKSQETVSITELKEHSESGQTLKEIQRIEDYYKDSDRAYDEFSSYSLPYMSCNTPILEKCYVIIKDRARLKREHAELKAVVDGNKEYYGGFQNRWQADREKLKNAELHLKLEQESYRTLYAKNRDLEAELYLLKREIEILKQEQ